MFSLVAVVQVLNHRYCNYTPRTTLSPTYRALPRFILGAMLLILTAIPALKQSVDMYKLTRCWQTNWIMKLLLREGAVYLVVYVSFVSLCHFCTYDYRLPFVFPSSPQKKSNYLRALSLSLKPGMCFSISSMQSDCLSLVQRYSWIPLVIHFRAPLCLGSS